MLRFNDVRPYFVCLSAGLFSFYDVFQLVLFNVINKNLMINFELSHYGLGIFSASFLVANALWLVPIGRLLDKYASRVIGLIFFTLAVFATITLAISNQLYISIFARIVQGMASATSLLLCTRLASQSFPQTRSFAIGCMFAMASLGGLCANTFWPSVVVEAGWRVALLASAMVGTAFIIFMFYFMHPATQNNNTVSFTIPTQIKLITSKTIGLGVYIGLMTLPLFILGALWGNSFLVHTYHLSLHQAGQVSGMLFWGMLVGTPMVGKLNDKVHKPYSIMGISPLICMALVTVLILGKANSPSILCTIFFLLGFSTSCQGLAFAQLALEFPAFMYSTAVAIAALSENIIGALSQPMFGKLMDITREMFVTRPDSWHYQTAMIVMPIGFLLCTFIILGIKLQSLSVMRQGTLKNAT